SSTTTVANEPVSFTFQGFPNLPPALLGTQNAFLSYSVVTTAGANAVAVPALGTVDSQPINQSFTMRFVRATPFTPAGHPKLHLTNLLTITLSARPGQSMTAQMYGIAGSSSVHLDSDASYATVDFTSDFLNFANTADHSMALSYTLQTMQYLGIGAKFLTAYDKTSGGTTQAGTCPARVFASTAICNYRGFTATESGNFGSAPPPVAVFTVPEPATMGVFGLGLLGLAASRRRRST
ncbi:MAG TPA: PEP-CTERM sorting domain-containing protein, partial [Acetobacteraceae bacterium]|nr:PEP-CTERM sorting domain-containing protein [Acetobacteraceae bacterium]